MSVYRTIGPTLVFFSCNSTVSRFSSLVGSVFASYAKGPETEINPYQVWHIFCTDFSPSSADSRGALVVIYWQKNGH